MTNPENIVVEFIKICQPSLDPQSYNEVIAACNILIATRKDIACSMSDILAEASKGSS